MHNMRGKLNITSVVLAVLVATLAVIGASFPASAAVKAPAKPSLTASSVSILQGESVTLSWSSQRASYCTLFPTGKTIMGSSASYIINNLVGTTGFYVTCVNSSGRATSNVVTVSVASSNTPMITAFVASPSSILYGESTTLNWSTVNVVDGDCSLSSHGVSGLPASGSYTTGPLKETQTYTLTCTNGSGTSSQTITVFVVDVIALGF